MLTIRSAKAAPKPAGQLEDVEFSITSLGMVSGINYLAQEVLYLMFSDPARTGGYGGRYLANIGGKLLLNHPGAADELRAIFSSVISRAYSDRKKLEVGRTLKASETLKSIQIVSVDVAFNTATVVFIVESEDGDSSIVRIGQ